MRMIDLIEKKKEKIELTKEEITFIINGYVAKEIPDYQISAFLMAIYFNGMTNQEIYYLTDAMLHSGEVIDLSKINGIKVDKHSTGGVGDKTSLVVGPLAASFGVKMAKMSGRGLGHTGGTLDKLESIPGYNIELTPQEFFKQVNNIGISIIGQTANVAPADKLLYALRDVTATVDSIPLIASSIMSKKLASGSDTILLDVKYGEGAFMHTIEDATKLAEAMISIGNSLGRNTMAMITDMNQPLGNTIGNAIEIREAIETLKGHGPKDFTELCMQAAEIMLMQGKVAENKEEARKMLDEVVASGKAFETFKDMVKAQGGNVDMIENPELLPQSKFKTEIKSEESGNVKVLHSERLGVLAMQLGAGRETKEQDVNHAVGLELACKRGDKVNKGDTICIVYHDEELKPQWVDELYHAFELTNEEVAPQPIIEKVLS